MDKKYKEETEEKHSIAYWGLKESYEKGNTIEIPSLGIKIEPDGSLENKTTDKS